MARRKPVRGKPGGKRDRNPADFPCYSRHQHEVNPENHAWNTGGSGWACPVHNRNMIMFNPRYGTYGFWEVVIPEDSPHVDYRLVWQDGMRVEPVTERVRGLIARIY
jgi:hypothetical protein